MVTQSRVIAFASSLALFVATAALIPATQSSAADGVEGLESGSEPKGDSCINIYHDEAGTDESSVGGPINAIMLANLIGHWPRYEIRVRPISAYKSADLEACKSTIYLGTSPDSRVPPAFLSDYFSTQRRVAWVGFGQEKLDKRAFEATFRHVVSGIVGLDSRDSKEPAFYQHVAYKDRLFRKSVAISGGKPEGAFEAVRFIPTAAESKDHVLANLIHNSTYQMTPYMLRSGSKFVVADIPFAYMHEGDRYFAFADLLFDILHERPIRTAPLAFARTEDIHGLYDIDLLKATLSAHRSENVPYSIAHIPLFADPYNAYGLGRITVPKSANDQPGFMSLIRDMMSDDRNTIIWHGVTHQFGEMKNPHSGTSGDDYEFWDMVANKPVGPDSPTWTLDRLSDAMPVFEAYGKGPRFWVTPHYHASAVNARVFAEVIPWHIGRVTYYASSFGLEFTLPAGNRTTALSMPDVSRDVLEAHKRKSIEALDPKSEGGLTQMFPYEIYRDVYGQRVLPETLGYMSYATSEQTAFIRTADDMLADARRNQVVRDYWASFFYHPYIFAAKEDGGVGRFSGDTLELRKLLIGLKLLGYTFTSLPEFEASLHSVEPVGQMGAASIPGAAPH